MRRSLIAVNEPGDERNIGGYEFQYKIMDLVEEITSEYWWCKSLDQPMVQGQSKNWKPDLVVAAEDAITLDDLYLAVIECKSAKRGASSACYWTHMSRAYMELDDLRLKREKGRKRFYLIMNRSPVRGEAPKLDYPKLFKNIEVEFIHGDDPEELASFEEQIHRLCREAIPSRQLKEIDPKELEKIPREVLESALERDKKSLDELKRVLDLARELGGIK